MNLRFNPRSLVALLHDLAWVAITWIGCFSLRLGVEGQGMWLSAYYTLPAVLIVHLGCFQYFGLYRGIWRFASLHDLRRIATAVLTAALIVPVVMLMWRYGAGVPRSVYFLQPLLLLIVMFGGRILYRWWKEEPWSSLGDQGQPVLMLSCDDGTLDLVDQFRASPNWKTVGILDHSGVYRGRSFAGIPVLGTWRNLADVAGRYGVRHAVLRDTGDHNLRRQAFDLCESAGIKLLLMPRVDDMLSGKIQFTQIREVELDDLLGRDPVELDIEGIGQMLRENVVLVTGAGGTIGSELCRQIARFEPSVLVLYEQSEFALYTVDQELTRMFPKLSVRCVIGDVKDSARLDLVFTRYRPSVVFHAAAYKHVPMTEQENAWSAVQNNAQGTWRLAQACERHSIDKLVFISTDKAVNPTNVMGATKRLAEMLLQTWARRSSIPTVIVRFGNVLGSTGSVVPKFKEQIRRGGPITVTHPEVRRYFMSVPEAVELVLQSALMGRSGEIFVLEMGEPVKIVDLARDLIRLSGLTEQEIAIRFVGLRPGEKLYEELLANSETTMPTRHPKVRIAKAVELPDEQWEIDVGRWLTQVEPVGEIETKIGLTRFVPSYAPYMERPNVIPLQRGGAARAG
ncbi:MAG: nucleoside-diphosphate sugar epimerase/dehydratase [Burkholderiaceae bacterium]